jgi:hypothetical protein
VHRDHENRPGRPATRHARRLPYAGSQEPGRVAAQCPGRPLRRQGHPKRSFLTAPQKGSSGPTLERPSLCRPSGPDDKGQAGGQALQARSEPPRARAPALIRKTVPRSHTKSGESRPEILGAYIRNQSIIASWLPKDDPPIVVVPERDRDKPDGLTCGCPKLSTTRGRRIGLFSNEIDNLPDRIDETVVCRVLFQFVQDVISVR